ncbi:MAG: hypothetical protein E6Z15_19735, partial [Paenibacillus macerans]|nr:hypothetical protein [Paenibacillus macerans]
VSSAWLRPSAVAQIHGFASASRFARHLEQKFYHKRLIGMICRISSLLSAGQNLPTTPFPLLNCQQPSPSGDNI